MQALETAKSVPTKVKNHLKAHKGAYVMGAVAVAAIALQQRNRLAFNEFLVEKGIDPEEYYCPEAYEEKQAANN
jgi:hypothetical protein